MKLPRMILPKSLLLAALTFPRLLMPAFAQQEVDPSWYDPWATAQKTATPSVPANLAEKRTARKLRPVAQRTKESQTQIRAHVPYGTQQARTQQALK